MPTDAQGYRAIEEATKKDKCSAIIQLFSIAMVFYRHPVGDVAFDEIRKLIGADALSALSFLTGFRYGSTGMEHRWKEFAGIKGDEVV